MLTFRIDQGGAFVHLSGWLRYLANLGTGVLLPLGVCLGGQYQMGEINTFVTGPSFGD